MSENLLFYPRFNNFEVIEQFNHQICIKAPCLYQDPERATIFEILLRKRDAVKWAKALPDIASVEIGFDPSLLSQDKLFLLLESLLDNIGSRFNDKINQIKSRATRSKGTESSLSLSIQGMSCNSCAMFLEMVLKQNSGIHSARVDYSSTSAEIKSQLSQKEVFDLIRIQGFEPVMT